MILIIFPNLFLTILGAYQTINQPKIIHRMQCNMRLTKNKKLSFDLLLIALTYDYEIYFITLICNNKSLTTTYSDVKVKG